MILATDRPTAPRRPRARLAAHSKNAFAECSRSTPGVTRWVAGLLATGLIAISSALSPAIAADKDQASAASSDWPMPRGDAQSTGFTSQSLAENLEVSWEFKADEAIETTPVIANGRVFVTDAMGKIYAITQRDGKKIWIRDYDTGFLAAPVVRGDLLVVGDVEGNLYGLNVADGAEIWKQTTEGEISGAAAFYKDNVLVTSGDGKLYCFAAKDGKPVWTYQTDDQIRCNPTIAGDRTFLGGCDGQLHVVDLNTGKSAANPLPLGGPTGSTPAVRGDQAFLPIMDGVILAFDWKQGKELWHHEDDERPQEYRNSAAVSDDLVIVSSQYKQVDALSVKTGDRVWRHTLKRRADASPLIAGDDVWIASTDGRLLRLSVKNGTETWKFEVRGAFLASPAIADGKLYIADDDGVVRCFAPKK